MYGKFTERAVVLHTFGYNKPRCCTQTCIKQPLPFHILLLHLSIPSGCTKNSNLNETCLIMWLTLTTLAGRWPGRLHAAQLGAVVNCAFSLTVNFPYMVAFFA